ncbi:MAG: hypothetical protein AB1716_25510 [Planctomycetota bacterium]
MLAQAQEKTAEVTDVSGTLPSSAFWGFVAMVVGVSAAALGSSLGGPARLREDVRYR